MTKSIKALNQTTPLYGSNAAYIEALYEQYLQEASSVPSEWQQYFATLGPERGDVAHGPIVQALQQRVLGNGAGPRPSRTQATAAPASEKQAAVSRLIQVYSLRGHQIADLDPLGLQVRHTPAVLKFDYLGLDPSDLDQEFFTGGFAGTGHQRMTLRDILALLKRIYCGKIGAEFAHISRARERLWLRERFEKIMGEDSLTGPDRQAIMGGLTRAEGIERYLNTKYVGQKRFSLEGGETLIPMLDDLIQRAGRREVQEIVIGMAHRGRLNVLVNVLGKAPEELFSEFEGNYNLAGLKGSGDVKYHMGFSSDLLTPAGNVHVALAFNPSHLEIVNPVVEGSVRARQERWNDVNGERVLPVLIHGDAAFAGQGVVTETFQLSQVNGFYTGGTVHIVINNQIGFTTSDPADARSTPYCSDVAKMIEAPVFHVNGDDPEAAVRAMRLALAYRQAFHKDVVVDLVCYRRLGHNEADEPAATQPMMYRTIRQHPGVRELYSQQLIRTGVSTQADIDKMADDYRATLDEGRSPNEAALGMIGNKHTVDWSRYTNAALTDRAATAVPYGELMQVAAKLNDIGTDFKLHPRVQGIVDDRRKMTAGELPLDWGFAETLAYGTLLTEDFTVRITGQDCRRGTFFHRHAALHEQDSGAVLVPLEHVSQRSNAFSITDSLLSEEAVLGFEYGYSTTDPDALVVWEAQFGDFVNGAQVVIDQFISSGEAKWGRLSGLTLFLPHGYEGQGPEHSSARMERFLQLCAEHNMQVCMPSTPAQMFHMLRRQMVRPLRKPLIVLSPKSLLRHPMSVSSLEDLTEGTFQPLIPEGPELAVEDVRRLVFCTGKVYFDLRQAQTEHELNDVALIRIEQLYPFPIEEYARTIEHYGNAHDIVWCQEEPQNQGAWYQIRHRLQEPLGRDDRLFYAGRPGAAAPASGMHRVHVKQQQALVEAALGITYREPKQ
jgi:2-oxoglutarate dehydrogenase E1 component